MSLQVQDLTYIHPDQEVLFQGISFSIPDGAKCAIVGNNGCGKSTLLRLMSRRLRPTSGSVVCGSDPYLVPQHTGQYDSLTVAEALGISKELHALHAILAGDVSERNFQDLDNRWNIEEEAAIALDGWRLGHLSLDTPLGRLSGGEKTEVFLAGIALCHPEVILLDEPTNHLDWDARERLYDWMERAAGTLIAVSHDRALLNRVSGLYELSDKGIRFYPMRYDAYKERKESERQAMISRLENQRKELRKAREEARDAMERQRKHDTRGEKLSARKGVARIAMGNLKNRAENSTLRLDKVQREKIQSMRDGIKELQSAVSDTEAMRVDFQASDLYAGKRLVGIQAMNFAYGDNRRLWRENLDLTIYSGERIWLTGGNGSGKSTLLRLITRILEPTEGHIYRDDHLRYVFLDQEYSLLRPDLTVREQAERFNATLPEHELNIRLSRLLFPRESWEKRCACLSGGERMRLALCCLMIGQDTPDLIIADEPTNNIDIENMDILSAVLNDFGGTLIVVSHDRAFVESLRTDRRIDL